MTPSNAHWFNELAEHMGPAYLRYSFTMGTAQEVAALIDLLELEAGQRVLDVGCGPGRHAVALADAGLEVTGVDLSPRFIELATESADAIEAPVRPTFLVADARELDLDRFDGRRFDAVISLCQGAFGLTAGPGAQVVPGRELDEPILAAMARVLAPSGRLAVSAFSAYFQLRYLGERDDFDADQGVNHEQTAVRDEEGRERPAELWTTCFTPRELRLLARAVGLRSEAVYGVTPGRYGPHAPSIECPEFLLLARPAT